MTAAAAPVVDGLQYCNWSRQVFKEMQAGGVGCVHATVAYWETARPTLSNIADWHQLFAQNSDLIAPAYTGAEVRQVIAGGRTAILFGFQHCAPIEEEIHLVSLWHRLGVRFMQLSYNNQSPLAAGCYENEDPGITRMGREVIKEMNRVGMVIDMSHSGPRSTLEAIELSRRPIAVTHANPAWWYDVPRNARNDVLRELARTGGMLGFSAYPMHLKDTSACTLQDFCAMVARTAEMTGTHCLGLGTDLCQGQPDRVVKWMRQGRWRFDDGQGVSWPPATDWFASNRDFPLIAEGLRRVGFDAGEVAALMGGNWLDFFDRSFEPNDNSATA